MNKILIIDDDVHIGNMLETLLVREGYKVTRAYSGTEALLVLKEHKPNLILLDLMLPGLSGEEVLENIKNIPVIVLSAKIGVADKVSLLLSGAVDYLTKPFDPEELLARITVQLRKNDFPQELEILTYGNIQLDVTSHQVTASGQILPLTKTEYAILKLLLQNPRQVIAKSVILDRISIDTPDCTERSLKQHISNLRKKIFEAENKDYIEAVWGIGFKLT